MPDTDRWRRVEQIFFEAAELQGADREAFLDQECGPDAEMRAEVLALLASDEQAAGFVEGNFQNAIVEFAATEEPRTLRAGPYLLTKLLGSGGMGDVYLATRDDGQYAGEVAVKLVRKGMDTDFFFQRFKRERQALARLKHPNIARLLDSGTAEDGSPYIVMELVDGIPVNHYCHTHNLDFRGILTLFRQICDAVAHAHRNFIVHRDLKPGNIFIEANGVPKLLDFGICKILLNEPGVTLTLETSNPLTPDYASPEQVAGDPITIASDIYSLGAVLYDLLARARPHIIEKLTPQAIAKAVCEDEVVAPSRAAKDPALARQLRGDLDTILLKALQKDPRRRYASVEAFSEDLRRVLDNEPVLARPDTALYRTSKFLRRNRNLTAAAALLIATLSAGVVAYAGQAARARATAAESRSLASAILFDIHDQIRDLPGALQARQNIVKIGLSYLDRMSGHAGSDASFRTDLAAAYLRMGEILGGVAGSYTGDTAKALESFRHALSTLQPVANSPQAIPLRMQLHRRIGQLLDARGDKLSVREFDSGIAAAPSSTTDPKLLSELAALYSAKALTLRKLEQRVPALDAANQASSLYSRLVAQSPSDIQLRAAQAANTAAVGTLERSFNQLPDARRNLELAAGQWDQIAQLSPTNVPFQRNRMLAYSHLGDLLGNPNFPNLGDAPAAQKSFDEMLAAARQLYTNNPGDQGSTIDYGMALGRVASMPLGSPESRLEKFAHSTRLLESAIRRDPSDKVIPMNLASYREIEGDFLSSLARHAEAAQSWRAALHILDRSDSQLPSAVRVRITCLGKLALQSAQSGNPAPALSLARQALSVAEKSANANTASVPILMQPPRAWAALGEVHLLLGNKPDAAAWLTRALEEMRRLSAMPGFHAEHKKLMARTESLIRKEAK
jgi:eukaryotic-like serine/threonine-protein kinase